MSHFSKTIFSVFLFSFAIISCKHKPDPYAGSGKLIINFSHYVDGAPIVRDSIKYVNAAGNRYSVTEIKYFVSEISLHRNNGEVIVVKEKEGIHYVDEDIPSTKKWEITDDIQAGEYDSISFIFGIKVEKNKSYLFVNPPEVNMMWPEILGGGYHLLMINGYWINSNNQNSPFNFHMGTGQIYKNGIINTDSIIGYVDNSFRLSLPASSFTLKNNETREIEIVMNIESWFKTPHIYDHNYWGGAIMQKQAAMQMAKENGWDVLTIGSIE
jgi:hypothetical protein